MSQLPVVKVLDFDPKSEPSAMGGGLEGAERFARETARWNPAMGSTDQIINTGKAMADLRSRDMAMNDGETYGAVATQQNSIVGGQYRLNARPNWKALARLTGLKFDQKWAEEFQEAVEALYELIADSDAHYLDASGRMTATDIVRLAVGGFCMTGEVLATAEWIKEGIRPINTAVQMVSPARLSNPNDEPDRKSLRRGIETDRRGRPIRYHIRKGHPGEFYSDDTMDSYTWVGVEPFKPWGRPQILHVFEPRYYEQSRGIADMVAALKQMRMTKKFSEITLQAAVVNATYAAAIESEMPPEAVAAMMGGGTGSENYIAAIGAYMDALGSYVSQSTAISIDGVKMPHLFPGTKLNLRPVGTPGGVGTEFEQSLKRGIAAALGMSYEEFTKDFSKVSYPGAKASAALTERFMQARKKTVADRTANFTYSLTVEELMSDRLLPLPMMTPRMQRAIFYAHPLARDAFCRASWVGASRGQIDELKETQAAILRIKSGLSTYEIETAKLGIDFRDLFDQAEREQAIIKKKKLPFMLDATRPGANDRQQTMNEPANDTTADDEDEDA